MSLNSSILKMLIIFRPTIDSYTQWKLVWGNLCEFILVGIKAKNTANALALASIFNADSEQNKKQKSPKLISVEYNPQSIATLHRASVISDGCHADHEVLSCQGGTFMGHYTRITQAALSIGRFK